MEKERLTKRDWQGALDVQCACNLSGVVHSFSKVISKIWNEPNVGTENVNHHPISVMYATQIAFLTNVAAIADHTTWSNAEKECQRQVLIPDSERL